jgi:hypothetical protein
MLCWVFELEKSAHSNNDDAGLYYNKDFIHKLKYLLDTSEKLSNKSMQGPQINFDSV